MGKLIIAAGVVFLSLTCLGFVGSLAYYWAANAGILSSWQALNAPPEKAEEIVGGDINVVYVRSVSKRIYGCKHEQKSNPEMCWYRASEPVEVDPETVFDQPLFESELSPPTSTVIDELIATIWYADAAFETRYALDEYGNVWKWGYDRSWVNSIVCFIGPLAGAAAGLFLAVVMWIIALLKRVINNRQRLRPNVN